MRWHEIISEDETQENNLVNNWKIRKPKATKIHSGIADVWIWSGDSRVVGYVVKDDIPLAYCSS